MSEVRLKIDIRNGTLEIEADKDSFVSVSERAGTLLDKFSRADFPNLEPEVLDASAEESSVERVSESAREDSQKPKRRRTGGAAKTANWQMVDNLLDENGRETLRSFFAEKKPETQNEQVAVLAIKLKDLTGRDGFDGNEIHTAFQIVSKKTPGNLNAVFGNMATVGLGSQVDKKFKPNFKAGDLVKHDLPRS